MKKIIDYFTSRMNTNQIYSTIIIFLIIMFAFGFWLGEKAGVSEVITFYKNNCFCSNFF